MSIARNSQSMMKQYSYKDGGMPQQMNNNYVFIVPVHNETVFMENSYSVFIIHGNFRVGKNAVIV